MLDVTMRTTQMAGMPGAAAAAAASRACGRPSSYLWLGADAKQGNDPIFVDVSGATTSDFHRHRRPWGTP